MVLSHIKNQKSPRAFKYKLEVGDIIVTPSFYCGISNKQLIKTITMSQTITAIIDRDYY